MQISDNTIVMTGGDYAESLVTEYSLADGNRIHLTSMRQGRRSHACGVYQDAGNQQVKKTILQLQYVEI